MAFEEEQLRKFEIDNPCLFSAGRATGPGQSLRPRRGSLVVPSLTLSRGSFSGHFGAVDKVPEFKRSARFRQEKRRSWASIQGSHHSNVFIDYLHLEQKEYDGYYFNLDGELVCFDVSLSEICDGLLIKKRLSRTVPCCNGDEVILAVYR